MDLVNSLSGALPGFSSTRYSFRKSGSCLVILVDFTYVELHTPSYLFPRSLSFTASYFEGTSNPFRGVSCTHSQKLEILLLLYRDTQPEKPHQSSNGRVKQYALAKCLYYSGSKFQILPLQTHIHKCDAASCRSWHLKSSHLWKEEGNVPTFGAEWSGFLLPLFLLWLQYVRLFPPQSTTASIFSSSSGLRSIVDPWLRMWASNDPAPWPWRKSFNIFLGGIDTLGDLPAEEPCNPDWNPVA